MVEIIETLNETSKNRTVFYCAVFLIALYIIFEGIIGIFKQLSKKDKKTEE